MGATFRVLDDDDFRRLEEALGDPDEILADISRNLAEEAINLIREGFGDQADPYGQGWAARKSGGGSAILVRTGTLRNAWHVVALGPTGFTVAAGMDYAQFHQSGTGRMVARKMVPDDDVPPKWELRFDDVVQEILDERLGR